MYIFLVINILLFDSVITIRGISVAYLIRSLHGTLRASRRNYILLVYNVTLYTCLNLT